MGSKTSVEAKQDHYEDPFPSCLTYYCLFSQNSHRTSPIFMPSSLIFPELKCRILSFIFGVNKSDWKDISLNLQKIEVGIFILWKGSKYSLVKPAKDVINHQTSDTEKNKWYIENIEFKGIRRGKSFIENRGNIGNRAISNVKEYPITDIMNGYEEETNMWRKKRFW